MNQVEKYLQHMRAIRSSGGATDETSYYTPLNNLLDEIGKSVKPRVRCIMQLKNRGAGNPDGGLFTPEQFQKLTRGETAPGQKPSRGAVEIKPTGDDAWATADGDQVTKYWKAYGQVLVTNYWDFVLLTRDRDGNPAKLDSFRLTPNEKAFWTLTEHPHKAAPEFADRFAEFLKRVMLSTATIAAPKDLASYLASLARDARLRVEEKRDLPALASLRSALEEALGLKFEGEKGEHFFRSTLIQTLFYGVFSAWVLWHKEQPATSKERFDWRKAEWSLHVPMIRVLYEEVSRPSSLKPLGLIEVLDLTESALNRVERKEFFARFEEQHAVQYFYEPFLEAFDSELRKQLGVWYTPIEIVKYMVARTDHVLREELKLADGFADPNVYVLDAACGTGAYLVEVLNTIATTLKSKGDDPLTAQKVKQFAMERVFGFEVLPAPFVISHLQLGLLLQQLGAPLSDTGDERVGVYLTNSLTGWEPPKGAKLKLAFPEMEKERDAADKVKRESPILVVIGNPPYNAFAGVSPAEEEGLVEPYKGIYWTDKLNAKGKPVKGKHGEPGKHRKYLLSDPEAQGGWDIRKFNLDDLYVRFFRLAERRLTEKEKAGVICYISNFSYLSDPSYAIMREKLLEGFESLWIDCLNGDSRETGKTTPDGAPDPSVFSTVSNPEGIQLGTAIGLMVRREKRAHATKVRYREFWGNNKRTDLVESLKSEDIDRDYQTSKPSRANRNSLRPTSVVPDYDNWPRPIDICSEAPISGLQEMRSEALIDIDKNVVEEIAKAYYDPKVKWDTLHELGTNLTKDITGFDAREVRSKLQKAEKFTDDRLRRYALYPLDSRWCYWTPTNPLWNRPRPALAAQNWNGNKFFIVRMFAERAREHAPLIVTSNLPDYHLLRPNAVAIPFKIKPEKPEADGHYGFIKAREDVATEPFANLSKNARDYLKDLGLANPDSNSNVASLIWSHSLAIGYSPLYLKENNCGIRYNWPRFPMPADKKIFEKSAELGESVSQLLDTEVGVTGVTSGTLRPDLKLIGNLTLVSAKHVDPGKHLKVDVGWGHEGKEGITMGGKGQLVERPYDDPERKAIEVGAAVYGLSGEQGIAQLGECTFDVYLNDGAYWKNVPTKVWEFTIGGYQVLKKWLSYRETKLLGRVLTTDEAYYFRDMVRRIASLSLLEPTLDANYVSAKANTYSWPAPVVHVALPGSKSGSSK